MPITPAHRSHQPRVSLRGATTGPLELLGWELASAGLTKAQPDREPSGCPPAPEGALYFGTFTAGRPTPEVPPHYGHPISASVPRLAARAACSPHMLCLSMCTPLCGTVPLSKRLPSTGTHLGRYTAWQGHATAGAISD